MFPQEAGPPGYADGTDVFFVEVAAEAIRGSEPSAPKILWRFRVIDGWDKCYVQYTRPIIIGKDNHEPARWIQKRVIARRHFDYGPVSRAQPKGLARVYCFAQCAGRHDKV